MVDAIGGMNIGSVVSTAGNRASVTRDQFLQILVTELTTQNPMDPLDNGEFMQQLVGLQSLEQTAALTDSLKSFERFMQMSTASNLIGQTIKGLTDEGLQVEGTVSRVVLEGNQVNLIVDGNRVPVTSVVEIVS